MICFLVFEDVNDDGHNFDKCLRQVLQMKHRTPGVRLYLLARYALTGNYITKHKITNNTKFMKMN